MRNRERRHRVPSLSVRPGCPDAPSSHFFVRTFAIPRPPRPRGSADHLESVDQCLDLRPHLSIAGEARDLHGSFGLERRAFFPRNLALSPALFAASCSFARPGTLVQVLCRR
jgi:hypothetical protein